ncbi:MAG: tRNA (guanosine(37)-N1)-methyltransferase TrmD [Pseudomonadota bacterium]
MRFDVVTLFPSEVASAAGIGVTGSAFSRGLASLEVHNPRDACHDAHRAVDDRPFGGGPGMVMRAEPLATTIRGIRDRVPGARAVLMSPQGRRFDQGLARRIAEEQRPVLLIAGRYEGVDERLMDDVIDEEWSVGDVVLSGGELAALVVMDAVIRLLPGVLGHPESAAQDSFSSGLLDCAHYTRPEAFEGTQVPSVLLSGDHAKIARWRHQQALGRTYERRPDLLARRVLTDDERDLLDAYRRDKRSCD